MVNIEPIWNRARVDLTIATELGEPDVFLWEHSVRIAKSSQRIAEMLQLQGQLSDIPAVVAAGLYHDAGWAVRFSAGEVKRTEILIRPSTENHRELGAVLLEKSLSNLLSAESLERAALAVRTLNDREIPNLEGQIVTEAEHLDEFGVISLWPTVRRGTVDGKGIRAAIETWRRRKEYQFWAARLNDSFRFPLVREVARTRLARMERVLEDLNAQQLAEDIVEESAVERLEPRSTRV